MCQTENSSLFSISEIEVAPVRPRDGLVAFASVLLGEQLFVGGLGLHSTSAPRHYRLVWPAKTLPRGEKVNFAYPITRQLGEAVEQAVIGKYEEVVKRLTHENNPHP